MKTEKDLFHLFDQLNIETKTYGHEPLFTVEQAKKAVAHIPGGHCKNLFLKDSKKRFWLIVAQADAKVSLKKMAKDLPAPELRFAQPELLKQYLDLEPGSVTPFGLINDKEHAITVVLDQSLFDYDTLSFHPLRNTASTTIAPQDLKKFIEHLGNRIILYEI